MYTTKNYKSKAAIKRDIQAGVKITCFAPGLGKVPTDGTIDLEGPHYPAPHTWYGSGLMQGGYLVGIK